MSERAAQLLLALMLLVGAFIFAVIDHDGISTALIGALLGQGASKGVQSAVNGNGGKK